MPGAAGLPAARCSRVEIAIISPAPSGDKPWTYAGVSLGVLREELHEIDSLLIAPAHCQT